MFDKLVESAKQKQGRRARRLFLATGMVYAVALTALGVATILGFNSALAEDYSLTTLIPPVPSGPDPNPGPIKPNLKSAADPAFVAPEKTTPPPDLDEFLDLKPMQQNLVPGGAPNGNGHDGIMPGVPDTRDPTPPPPTPTPAPVVKPAATPTDTVVKLTSKLTQGRVLRKVEPPYPTLAMRARIEGSVQVQIDISETGAVTNVTLLSGHPFLREAAAQAAKQWLFVPTELNGQRVRAIGVLTFNFKLY